MRFLTGVILMIGLVTGTVGADSSHPRPQAGRPLPHFSLPVPSNPDHQAYLGLPATGQFGIGNIKAQLVIIEIFSMY